MDTIYNNPNDYWLAHPENSEQPGGGCLVAICYAMAFAAIMVLLFMFSACTTTEYVQVPVVHNDTVLINHTAHDSIFMHDSIHIKEKGDTVWIERWHTKWENHFAHDTTYISKTDTVPVPHPVEKLVERELTWWQKTRMHCGEVLLLAVLAGIVYVVLKLRKKL